MKLLGQRGFCRQQVIDLVRQRPGAPWSTSRGRNAGYPAAVPVPLPAGTFSRTPFAARKLLRPDPSRNNPSRNDPSRNGPSWNGPSWNERMNVLNYPFVVFVLTTAATTSPCPRAQHPRPWSPGLERAVRLGYRVQRRRQPGPVPRAAWLSNRRRRRAEPARARAPE